MASDGEISCTNDPNFAVIYSFLKVFGNVYGLEIPTITQLQELIENTQEVLDPLKELHLRLLRRALKSVQSNRWERCLIKFCHQHGHHQEAWEMERFTYKKASTQVKLKILKILLEYQFTCHPKFKSAVNAIACKELRLDPIGTDKNGCIYWMQVDHDANLCLYKEDQDEETWQLIARNREELVSVIAKLKSGEEICPSAVPNSNEDSNSAEEQEPLQSEPTKAVVEPEEENEEEFLSPESESENDEEQKPSPSPKDATEQKIDPQDTTCPDEPSQENDTEEPTESSTSEATVKREKSPETDCKQMTSGIVKSPEASDHPENSNRPLPQKEEDSTENQEVKEASEEKEIILESKDKSEEETDSSKNQETNEVAKPDITSSNNTNETPVNVNDALPSENQEQEDKNYEVEEAIEEPVMIVTGEGNGADCESGYIIGEEICEPVMFFYGEGSGYDNDTGNLEAVEHEHNATENSAEENGNDDCVNGKEEVANAVKTKTAKNAKLKGKSVVKRTLKKQSTDNSEAQKTDIKKHCVRNFEKEDSPNLNSKSTDKEKESSVTEKSTDSESPNKNNVKKGRNKVKKKVTMVSKLKVEKKSVLNSVTEIDNGHDSKTSIIEKRKSSLSSEEQEDVDNVEKVKDSSPSRELKVEDTLPPKKLRLETTPDSDINVSHSKESVDTNVNSESKNQSDDNVNDKIENKPVSERKKVKASKLKFKRKRKLNAGRSNDNGAAENVEDVSNNSDKKEGKAIVKNKSLKRSFMDATLSDKNKSESQSESEEEEPVTSGKRLKIKPKKIDKSTRKKVEEKLKEQVTSDESEEETLYSLASKKTTKKALKKKSKGQKNKSKSKDKSKTKSESEESDAAPVRQSRRIAQLKIREEAERRQLEEVALRELKMLHKKKGKDESEEEEWKAEEGSASSEGRGQRVRRWRGSASSGPEPDSDSDEPLFEPPEPDLDFSKSDHEFSPESDLENGEPAEPLKRARTLHEEEKDSDGFCRRCGSGEQPEWILLCDGCDAGYHAACLKPVLFYVPEGDWYCPPCNHAKLIASLESELAKYDTLLVSVEAVRAQKREEEAAKPQPVTAPEGGSGSGEDDSEASSDWSGGAVYRLRARKQLPVSFRDREYDRLISSAIKEEYVEPTTSAGNQGRGKDISTIIEAAEEEKLKAEREAIEQGKPLEKKARKKQRRKPRKLNSLEVPSEDDDETDEDFKDTGLESSSEEISSSAERGSSGSSSGSSRPARSHHRDRSKLVESSPEVKKKKKGVFDETSSESEEKKRSKKKKSKSHSKPRSRPRGLTQYDAAGNVVRARIVYGALSDDNDWSPKHRTRQKKIDYTEMPNTESEDEMHKSSGKHMADSSDEFKVDDSDLTSDSEEDRAKRKKEEENEEERRQAIRELITRTAVVPLEKLPEDVTKAKTEELQAHLDAAGGSAAAGAPAPGPPTSRRGRGGRGSRARPGRGRGRAAGDDALAKYVGVKIKDLNPDGTMKPLDAEREKKRQEREAKIAEKEARKQERLQKKEEKEKLKEQKAKEREEKRLARLALQESKRMKKERPELGAAVGPPGPPGPPRLQVRAELRGVLAGDERLMSLRAEHPAALRDGTLSVAGSPQPYKPISEEPSVITRMPHMLNQQYRGPMLYGHGGHGYRPPGYPAPGLRPQYAHYYHHMRGLPYGPPGHPGAPQGHPGAPQGHPGAPQGHPGSLQGHPGAPQGHPGAPQGHPGTPQGLASAGHHGAPPGHHGTPPGHHGVPPGHPGAPPGHHGGPPGHHASPPSHHGIPPGHPGSPHTHPGAQGHPGLGRPGPSHPGHPHPSGPHQRSMHPGPPHVGSPHSGPPHPGPSHTGPQHPGSPHPRPLHPGHSHPSHPHPGPPHSRSPHPGLPPGATYGPPRGPTPPGPAATPPPPRTPVEALGAVRIKSEVKTEPPERSPPSPLSPRPASPRGEAPRNHPKIKHTDNKDRRPRFPLGPYAPQYGPYGPYAPPPPPAASEAPLQRLHQLLPPRPPPHHPPYLRPPEPSHHLAHPSLRPPMHPATHSSPHPPPNQSLHTISHLSAPPPVHPPAGHTSALPVTHPSVHPPTQSPGLSSAHPPAHLSAHPPAQLSSNPSAQSPGHPSAQSPVHSTAPPPAAPTPPAPRPPPHPAVSSSPHRTPEASPSPHPPAAPPASPPRPLFMPYPTAPVPRTPAPPANIATPPPQSAPPTHITPLHSAPLGHMAPPAHMAPPVARREESGVFGGLVSYFSSQREDDMDA